MWLFQLQRISAIALLAFMTIHMMVLHYPPFHIDFTRILERMADPLWKAIDIAFLFFVLIHALAGTYAVLTDFDRVSRVRKVLAAGGLVIGLAAFFYGAATILAFQPPV
jgi:succinate dehydrogenase / fumarate reductase membrane anchor subunit